jgi:hypothetical protein
MIGPRNDASRQAEVRHPAAPKGWFKRFGRLMLAAALSLAAFPAQAAAQESSVRSSAARTGCPIGSESVARRPLRFGRGESERYLVIFGEEPDPSRLRGFSHTTKFSVPSLIGFRQALQAQLGRKVVLTYDRALIGFLANLTRDDVRRICEQADKAFVPVVIAPDRVMGLPEPYRLRRGRREAARFRSLPQLPNTLPLGIDRVDERLLQVDRHFRTLQFAPDVHVYVIDTGIYGDHSDFKRPDDSSRVTYEQVPGLSESTQAGDCLGHGTAVASVIAGLDHGIAKEAELHSIRVFAACSKLTYAGSVMAAVNWVTKQRERHPTRPMLVNISLASLEALEPDPNKPDSYDLLDAAIERSILKNVTYVIAAGNNQGGDACLISPARVEPAITVSGIIPTTDGRPDNANEGECIDLFAPGHEIRMAWIGGPTREKTDYGTSFAAPHVAGVAALVLQYEFLANPGVAAEPLRVWKIIDHAATTREKISPWCGIANIKRATPEKLLHWGSGSADGTLDEFPYSPTEPPCPNPERRTDE